MFWRKLREQQMLESHFHSCSRQDLSVLTQLYSLSQEVTKIKFLRNKA